MQARPSAPALIGVARVTGPRGDWEQAHALGLGPLKHHQCLQKARRSFMVRPRQTRFMLFQQTGIPGPGLAVTNVTTVYSLIPGQDFSVISGVLSSNPQDPSPPQSLLAHSQSACQVPAPFAPSLSQVLRSARAPPSAGFGCNCHPHHQVRAHIVLWGLVLMTCPDGGILRAENLHAHPSASYLRA